MSKRVDRFLITTADERSWVFDQPVLFLGEWCCRYNRKHIWSRMDAIVAEPYGVAANQKIDDLEYVNALVIQLLVELTTFLNNFHGVSHSERYWNILIGHWLRRYITVVFNRYQTLKQALENYELSGSIVFNSDSYSLASSDSLNFLWGCNDDKWNHMVYSNILSFIAPDIELISDSEYLSGTKGFLLERCSLVKKKNIRGVVRSLIKQMGTICGGSTDAFIRDTYLPAKQAATLQLLIGQIPQLWQSPKIREFPINLELRTKLKLESTNENDIVKYIRREIFNVIPSCYLEGYSDLTELVETLPWPKTPKFIFACNGFDTDEVFKAWIGSKIEQGIPYFAGQHGNNYGTWIGCNEIPELTTCDKFLTWGWHNENTKNVPMFIFKNVGKKKHYSPKGGCLLVEVNVPHSISTADVYYEFGLYQEEQFGFINTLPNNIQKELTIRLHQASKQSNWSDEQRWFDYNPEIKLSPWDIPIEQLISKSRLVVYSYDSTGILESLSLNIPTICFWRGEFEHLIAYAKPFYELLKQVGIFHGSPESAADFISKHWNNIDLWWSQVEVQNVRKIFCDQYARTKENPIRFLNKSLKKISKVHNENCDVC